MNWQKYPYTQPRESGWYLVWEDVPGHYDYDGPHIDYFDGKRWKWVTVHVNWWCEITPPPINKKDR